MSIFELTKTNTLMSKDSLFSGQPVFSQILSNLPFDNIDKIIAESGSDKYCKKFTTKQQLITMLYGITSGCNSIREVCGGVVSYGDKISHCKLDYAVPRSTFSDANKKRPASVFESIYNSAVAKLKPFISDSGSAIIAEKYKLFAIDSTTISLFQPIFKCVGRKALNGKAKGGVKSHQKLDIQSGIPIKIWNSDATNHDSIFIHREDIMMPNEVAIMDRAYNDYKLFADWTEKDIYFVTRLKDNAKEKLIEELDLSDSDSPNVLRDAKIALEYGEKDENGKKKSVTLRLVSYYDPQEDRSFYFLTNIFDESADAITNIYKKRWDIELLFKKIKQNFPLTYFYGDNKNAIEIQIWCTMIACLLITYIQKISTKNWGFSNLVSIIQKHLFSYVKCMDFLNNMEKYSKEYVKEKVKKYNNGYQTEIIFT